VRREPDSYEQLEVGGSKISFNVVQVVDKAREKAEKRFLLEFGALLLMHIGQNKDEY
jgi:hypothetical protein